MCWVTSFDDNQSYRSFECFFVFDYYRLLILIPLMSKSILVHFPCLRIIIIMLLVIIHLVVTDLFLHRAFSRKTIHCSDCQESFQKTQQYYLNHMKPIKSPEIDYCWCLRLEFCPLEFLLDWWFLLDLPRKWYWYLLILNRLRFLHLEWGRFLLIIKL
jgi:hypothetical protein